MRSRPLHEGHLAEAQRQGVITEVQREAILAIARSTDAATAPVPLDAAPFRIVQAVGFGLAALAPLFEFSSNLSHLEPVTVASVSGVCAVVLAVAGILLRRHPRGLVAGGVAMATSVACVWAFTAACVAIVHSQPITGIDFVLMPAPGRAHWWGELGSGYLGVRTDILAIADLAAIIVGLIFALRLRAPMALVVVAWATIQLAYDVALYAFVHTVIVHPMTAFAIGGIVATLLSVTGARVLERRGPRDVDGAFWLDSVALVMFGAMVCFYAGRASMPWMAAVAGALVLIAIGVWARRRIFLAFAATAALVWPLAWHGQNLMTMVVASGVVVALGAVVVRAVWDRGRPLPEHGSIW